jgi:hypothetical protein
MENKIPEVNARLYDRVRSVLCHSGLSGAEPLTVEDYTDQSLLVRADMITTVAIADLQKEFDAVWYDGHFNGLVIGDYLK